MFKEFCYYLYEIHTGKESDNSKFFSATIGISFLHSMNVMAVWGITNYLFNLLIPKDSVIILGVFISVLISVINYFYLYRKRNEIIKKIEGFSSKREKIGKTFFIVYIISTLFLLFYVINNFVPVRY